jgi:hypothetical protein
MNTNTPSPRWGRVGVGAVALGRTAWDVDGAPAIRIPIRLVIASGQAPTLPSPNGGRVLLDR